MRGKESFDNKNVLIRSLSNEEQSHSTLNKNQRDEHQNSSEDSKPAWRLQSSVTPMTNTKVIFNFKITYRSSRTVFY